MSEKKSPKTKNTPVGIAYLMGRVHHALARTLREELATVKLTLSQYTALSFLSKESLSNAQLAERSMISPQSANEMVKTMTNRGWIVREPDPTHGRIIRISLTDEGKEKLALGNQCVANVEAIMLAEHTNEDQQKALYDDLRTILRCLSTPGL